MWRNEHTVAIALLLMAGALARADTPPPQAGENATATTPASAAKSPAAAPAPRPTATPTAHDRLELDPTAIIGNRELPKVMVIVPWKKSDIGDLAGKPPNSLVDEVLQPVNREEFRREIQYHAVLNPDRARSETAVTPAAGTSRPDR